MNATTDNEQLEQWVIRYLYDDFSTTEKAEFEQELVGNLQLQRILAAEQHLNGSLPIGTSVYIDNQRQEENRRLLRRNLQKQVANRSAVSKFLVNLLRKPSLVAFQSVALAASFVAGVLIDWSTDTGTDSGISMAGMMTPLSLVSAEDYEIADMQIASFNPVSGEIDLTFSIASETQLKGNVADAAIRTLMTVALLNEIDAAARLDTIGALQNAVFDEDLSASMIHVLNNDNNPGVRYSAALSLVNYVENDAVRKALRSALSEDVNPGVRLEAFNALAQRPDTETLELFRQLMNADGNSYIRDRARSIVEGTYIGNNIYNESTDNNNLPTDIF